MALTKPEPNVHVAASPVQDSMIRCIAHYSYYALTCYSESLTTLYVVLLAQFCVDNVYNMHSLLFHKAATITEG